MFAVPLPTLEELAKERAERAVAVLGRLRSSPVALVAPPTWGPVPDAADDEARPPGDEPGRPHLLALPAPADAEDADGHPSQAASELIDPPVAEDRSPVQQVRVETAVEVTSEGPGPADSVWCTATRADGEACRARAVPGRGVCIGHGQWRRTSGGPKARRSGRADRALAPVLEQLERALAGLVEGRLDVQQATVAASIGRLLLAAHGSTDLQERLSALEAGLTGPGDATDH